MSTARPVYLFSDSQLLFRKLNGVPFLRLAIDHLQRDAVRAAYIGASNGDRPEFYQIFKSAMEGIGNRECRMIRSNFSKDEQGYVEAADIVLLAGGDVERGWRIFQSTGLSKMIVRKYQQGALLMGISAGAIQLGLCGWREKHDRVESIFDTLKIVPYVLGAHEEKDKWRRLRATVLIKGGNEQGFGIPFGGGMIYRADKPVAAIRYPLYKVSARGDDMSWSLLMPDSEYAEARFQ